MISQDASPLKRARVLKKVNLSRVVILFATLLLTSVTSCRRHTSVAPYAVVPQTSYNFSELWAGENVTHDFYIKNDGESPLLIEGILSPCKCLFARVSNRKIEPHGEITLSVNLNTKGLAGPLDHKIIVYTNATNERVLTFKVTAYVKQLFSLQPESVDFGELNKNISVSESVIFTSTSISITSVTSSSPYIKVVLHKPAQQTYNIELILNKELPPGLLKSNVLVYTTSSKVPVLNIPVKAKKRSELHANPDEIFAGILLKGTRSSIFSTYIFSSHKKPFAITKVYDTNGFLDINTERLAPDIYKIDVSAKAFDQQGEYTSDILIFTIDPKTPAFQIPFRVIVMNR